MSEAKLIKGTVCSDHVHLYIAIPPKLSVSKFMSYLKGIIHFVRSNRLCLLLSFSSANRCCSLDEKDKGVGVDIIAEVSGLSAKRIESM